MKQPCYSPINGDENFTSPFLPDLTKKDLWIKRILFFIFSSFVVLFIQVPVCADDPNCENLSFELGNFTNWEGYTWNYSTEVPSATTSKVKGIVSRRQTIISDTMAYDANTGNALKKIPSGFKYSVRLGDATVSSDANPRCWEQSLRYTMTIDSANALLIMKFACVLEYASDHTAKMEPRFRVTLFNNKGDTIPDCANYDVYASSGSVSGFQSYTPSGSMNPVKWRDWTTVGANLLKYVGQTITIEFMSADCTGRFHYGYAYFLAECRPLYITVKYCAGDSNATLTAPEGFVSYRWENSSGTVVGAAQVLKVANPDEGATFSCIMTSATGCTVTLQSTIVKYLITNNFTSSMIDCKSNKVQLTNLSKATHGSLTYQWDFGDTKTSTEQNPQHTFATSGIHQVSLILTNPPSACVDTLTKDVESFSPPLVGIKGESTYCPGLTTCLKAYGAYQYKWSNGSVCDSIEVGAPGGKYWLLGHSSTGCVSDTIYKKVSEEPDWQFSLAGDTIYCKGDSTILTASGAATYLWNTGETKSSIAVKTAGTFTVTGANVRGCKKSEKINEEESPLPNSDFTLSGTSVNSKHNQLSCSGPANADVQYVWNMGDGAIGTGSAIEHTYMIDNSLLEYRITLTATSKLGCVDSVSHNVDVTLFIPNVFTPNDDGINDVFMTGVELQIFDRNGLILYRGNTGWNGKYNGQAVDPDTYFYLIRYTNKNKQVQNLKGCLTLLR